MHDLETLDDFIEKQQLWMISLKALLTVPLLFPAFEPGIFV